MEMRKTVGLDVDLHKRLKREAAESGISVQEIVRIALDFHLAELEDQRRTSLGKPS